MNRRIEQVVGEYVDPVCECGVDKPPPMDFDATKHADGCPKNGGGKFMIRTIPRPPTGRIEILRRIRDGLTGKLHEIARVSFACPHCHRDLDLEYISDDVPESVMKRLREIANEISSLKFNVYAFRFRVNDPLIRRLIDVCESLRDRLTSVF